MRDLKRDIDFIHMSYTDEKLDIAMYWQTTIYTEKRNNKGYANTQNRAKTSKWQARDPALKNVKKTAYVQVDSQSKKRNVAKYAVSAK